VAMGLRIDQAEILKDITHSYGNGLVRQSFRRNVFQ
jgi:hypothetical protein